MLPTQTKSSCVKKILKKISAGKSIECDFWEIAGDAYYTSWESHGNEAALANLLSLVFLGLAMQFSPLKEPLKCNKIAMKQIQAGGSLENNFFARRVLVDLQNEQEKKDNDMMEKKRIEIFRECGGTIEEYIRILKTSPKWMDLGDYLMAIKFVLGIHYSELLLCKVIHMQYDLLRNCKAIWRVYQK